MTIFFKSHDFSSPFLLFVRDLSHNFQKETGSPADMSQYFLSPPSHRPPFFHLVSRSYYSFSYVSKETVLLQASSSVLRSARPSFTQTKGKARCSRSEAFTEPPSTAAEKANLLHHASLHRVLQQPTPPHRPPLPGGDRGRPDRSAQGSSGAEGSRRGEGSCPEVGTTPDAPQRLPAEEFHRAGPRADKQDEEGNVPGKLFYRAQFITVLPFIVRVGKKEIISSSAFTPRTCHNAGQAAA